MSAVSEGGRKLDLYDFFSVLLPGFALLLSLVPLFPRSIDPLSAGMVIFLLLGGFIVGRGIHSVAVYIEEEWETIPTHRERFEDELVNPTALNEETIRNFRDRTSEAFRLDEIDPYLKKDDGEYTSGDLYALTRSAIHIDGRGRSRTFQATYAFYRSMWIVTSVIGVLYYLYAFGKVFAVPGSLAGFTSHLGSSQIEPAFIGLIAVALCFLAHYFFRGSREQYQTFYIQYLITDFITINSSKIIESNNADESTDT